MELISVIVPIYKVEEYLDQCIRSIINQTYENLEIILVDDGSPDKCGEICDLWAKRDKRIRVIHKENGGISDARNTGMKLSSGNYISFIDSDDFIEPEFIEYLYKALCETGADISQCSYHQFSGHSEVYGEYRNFSSPTIQTGEEALAHFSRNQKPANHMVWDKLYRRELVINEPFLYGYQAQDVLFSCHVFSKCKFIARIDNVLYHWRIRPGSASATFFKQRMDTFETLWLSMNSLEKTYPHLMKSFKNSYITICFGAYDWLLEYAPKEKRAELMNTVNEYRHRIRYSKEEWSTISLKNKIRYICSEPALIKYAVKARQLINQLSGFKRNSKPFV